MPVVSTRSRQSFIRMGPRRRAWIRRDGEGFLVAEPDDVIVSGIKVQAR